MLLKHVTVENFKGHVHCEIDFKPGFNLLIGDNGMGKTSILEAVSVGLGGFIAGIDDVAPNNFTKDEIRISSMSMGDGSFHTQYETPVAVTCTAEIDDAMYEWTRRKTSVKSTKSTVEIYKNAGNGNIKKAAHALSTNPEAILPVLSYQSAARTWIQKKQSTEDVFKTEYNRTVGYAGCLGDTSDPKDLINWCAKMEQVQWQKGQKIGEYEAVKKALSHFMSVMNDGEEIELQFDKQSSELSYIAGKKALPIRYLSAGYQSVIWMVLDIAYRMAVLNPNLKEAAATSPGVILIDEVDMHLHPKWQWKVIEALQTTFPNVQFIAATHSPMLIASCKTGQLISIAGDEVSYGESAYGMEVNDVLCFTQGSTDMDKAVKEKIDSLYALIEDGNLNQAKEKVRDLEKLLGEGHPELSKVKTALEFETAIVG